MLLVRMLCERTPERMSVKHKKGCVKESNQLPVSAINNGDQIIKVLNNKILAVCQKSAL